MATPKNVVLIFWIARRQNLITPKALQPSSDSCECLRESDLHSASDRASSDECMKSGAYLRENLVDPVSSHSPDPEHTSFQKAYRFEGTRWEFLEHPQNQFKLRRYGAAMASNSKLQPPDAILKCTLPDRFRNSLCVHILLSVYDWTSLPSGTVFADMGSGIGNVSLEIAKVRPDFTFVLEDRPAVVENAQKVGGSSDSMIAKRV